MWNAENRMQGELDSPLTQKGQMDAARQHEILRTRDLAGFRFFTSPQGRAFQTAAIALAGLAGRIQTDDRLREIGVGRVGSVVGRFWAMDRDNRWNRVERAINE